jgi:hypothetical protein
MMNEVKERKRQQGAKPQSPEAETLRGSDEVAGHEAGDSMRKWVGTGPLKCTPVLLFPQSLRLGTLRNGDTRIKVAPANVQG